MRNSHHANTFLSDKHEAKLALITSISFPKKLALALVADSKGGGGAPAPSLIFLNIHFFVVFQELRVGKAKAFASFGPFCTPPEITINLIIISYHPI